jgi:hypothetical protein
MKGALISVHSNSLDRCLLFINTRPALVITFSAQIVYADFGRIDKFDAHKSLSAGVLCIHELMSMYSLYNKYQAFEIF